MSEAIDQSEVMLYGVSLQYKESAYVDCGCVPPAAVAQQRVLCDGRARVERESLSPVRLTLLLTLLPLCVHLRLQKLPDGS